MKRGLFNDDGPIKTKQQVRPAQQMTPEMKIEIEKKEKKRLFNDDSPINLMTPQTKKGKQKNKKKKEKRKGSLFNDDSPINLMKTFQIFFLRISGGGLERHIK